jgi:hypothetical protein
MKILASICLCGWSILTIGHEPRYFGKDQNTTSQRTFRYIICGNLLMPQPGPHAVRNICVLMDEGRFDPETLKELFRLLSTRFPEPVVFDCSVFTSLDQLATPEEQDRPRHSETREPTREEHHHRAVLLRSAENEIIRYTARPGDSSLRTIILKGRDPMSPPPR